MHHFLEHREDEKELKITLTGISQWNWGSFGAKNINEQKNMGWTWHCWELPAQAGARATGPLTFHRWWEGWALLFAPPNTQTSATHLSVACCLHFPCNIESLYGFRMEEEFIILLKKVLRGESVDNMVPQLKIHLSIFREMEGSTLHMHAFMYNTHARWCLCSPLSNVTSRCPLGKKLNPEQW